MVINGFLVGNKVANRLFLSEYSIVLVEHSGSKIDKSTHTLGQCQKVLPDDV